VERPAASDPCRPLDVFRCRCLGIGSASEQDENFPLVLMMFYRILFGHLLISEKGVSIVVLY